MKPSPRTPSIVAATAVAALVTFLLLSENGVFNIDIWERDCPLPGPIAVTRVHDGTVTLADGRMLRPAGVRRSDDVTTEEYDNAMAVICAQGVVVIRDLGDGSAFLLAEPKFYNWCGTRRKGKRWAGWYFQCPMSEFLIQSAYAKPALDQAGLTARERWRLEGVEHIGGIDERPTRVSADLAAFRYTGQNRYFSDYDATLELMWKPPPLP